MAFGPAAGLGSRSISDLRAGTSRVTTLLPTVRGDQRAHQLGRRRRGGVASSESERQCCRAMLSSVSCSSSEQEVRKRRSRPFPQHRRVATSRLAFDRTADDLDATRSGILRGGSSRSTASSAESQHPFIFVARGLQLGRNGGRFVPPASKSPISYHAVEAVSQAASTCSALMKPEFSTTREEGSQP